MRMIHDDPDERTEMAGGVVVPTMGALHAGHLSLIEHAASLDVHPVVVTVFVNPTQFAPGEDYTQYPRTLEQDSAKCEEAGADIVFAPAAETVYPNGTDDTDVPPLPDVATKPGLEDHFRPSHFAGVCQVVKRLFELVQPAHAVFGQKDYQQLLVITAMTEQLGLRIEIIGRPTVRDVDGLALSSRNAYLSPVQRRRALSLNKALAAAQGASTPDEAERAMKSILLTNQVALDYAVVRDARTLMPVESLREQPTRAIIAGRVGKTRLIDNAAIA